MNEVRQLFSFEGSIGRAKFWLAQLAATVFIVLPSFVFYALDAAAFFGVALVVQYAVGLWIAVAAGIKRLRDRAKSGWWLLVSFIPYLGFVWYVIELGMLPGEEKSAVIIEAPQPANGPPNY